MSRIWDRRSLLRTLAVGAGAFPTLAPLGRAFLPRAHAAASGAPRRVIFFANPNGYSNSSTQTYESWLIKPGATWEASTFGEVLKPLERHKKNVVVVQGLESKMSPAFKEQTSAHRNADIMLYTGTEEGPKMGRYYGMSKNASIDYYLAEKLGKQVTPRFPFIMPGLQSTAETHTYTTTGDALWHNDNPVDLYQKLFADLVIGGGPSAAPDPAVAARLARKQSILDGLKSDVTAFCKTLGKADRERADCQLAAIRTLESRLVAPTGAPARGCAKPTAPAATIKWKFPDSSMGAECMAAMSDLMVAALACDLTRVVTFGLYGGDHHLSTCGFAPISSPRWGWHALSHNDPGDGFTLFRKAKAWATEQVAVLADKLAAIPEAGGSMLDNTLIVMAQEHGWGHEFNGIPWVTVGGKNLGVKVGQFIKVGEPRRGMGTEVNRMLVATLNAMGLPDETYGAELGGRKGPLPGYLG
jgi:hypothetical protein